MQFEKVGRGSNLWPNFSCLYKHLVETELQSILSDWLNTTENIKKKLIISQGNKRLTWFGINRTWDNYVTMYLLKLIILYKIHTAQIKWTFQSLSNICVLYMLLTKVWNFTFGCLTSTHGQIFSSFLFPCYISVCKLSRLQT